MLEIITGSSFLLYFSIFTIVMLEYANFPLPSELVLPLAGALAIPFKLNLGLVIALSIIGGVLGSIINYYLGYKYGRILIDWMIKKMPKSKNSFDVSYSSFEKYKGLSVLLSRVVPIARTMISIIAGTLKMNCLQFTIFSTIGISIWNVALICGGYLFFDNLGAITSILKTYSVIIKGIILIVAIIFAYKHFKNKEVKKTK